MDVPNDPELAERMRVLRVHGSKQKYNHNMIGWNFRIDTMQEAVLNVKLNYLDGRTKQRQESASRHGSISQQSALMERGNVRLPKALFQPSGAEHYNIYNLFVLRVEGRGDLIVHLNQNCIEAEISCSILFHLPECFRYLGYRRGDFHESERTANETLAIQIYPEQPLERQA